MNAIPSPIFMDALQLLGVCVAAILNMAVGTVWYSRKVFGDMWLKEIGLHAKDVNNKSMFQSIVTAFICYLVTAFVLFRVLQMSVANFTDLATMVLMIWAGFIAAVRLSHYVFEKKSFRLFLIVSFHDLAGLVVTALTFWFFHSL